MARTTRAVTTAAAAGKGVKGHTSPVKKTNSKVKQEPVGIKQEALSSPQKSSRTAKRPAASVVKTEIDSPRSSKRVKRESKAATVKNEDQEDEDQIKTGLLSPSVSGNEEDDEFDGKEVLKKPAKSPRAATKPKSKSKGGSADKSKDLSDRKLQAYFKHSSQSPYPDFVHPTPEEAKLAHKILSNLHGERIRPEKVVASTDRAGCGDSPSVLDALVRTILSQNTSDKNSTRAKRSMDAVYGGSDRWDAIVAGGQPKLEEAIQTGGLAKTKSKVILSILEQARAKYGTYSLDHLHDASSEDAMREMLAFQGVGPKTASCVLLFCLQRDSFAVDTHVHRITGLLGWRPKSAGREETHSHLDARIPDEDKYGLHILLVKHGKVCDECKAGGKSVGKCELRKAFRQGKIKGEAGPDLKEEELLQVEKEKKRK